MLFTRQFFWLFRWHVVRYARRHALLAALNVLSVALGVAVYLAIQIANHSANQSFTASIDLVAGKANLEVRSPSGGFDEALLARLRHAPGVKAATPLVEGYVTLPDYPGEFLQVLGLDVFTNVPFATFAVGTPANAAPATDQTAGSSGGGGSAGPLDLESWLGQPDGVAVSEEFARLYRLRVGDRLRVQVDGRDATLVIRNLISLKDSPAGRGNSRVAAMDIGWAQELFRRAGRLSAIQLLVDRPLQAERIAADLRPLAPPDVTINPPGQRSGQVQRMLAGFELNLGALSLVALLVGMFLISNTVTASVVRRRTEVGTLRAAGASQAEVTALFLAEALLYGLVGVAVGVVGGVLLAQYLIGEKVAQVIRTLYILVSIDRYYLTPWLVGTAAFFGLGSVLLAAWLPAWHGARIHPVAALSLGPTMERGRLDAPRWLVGGAVGLVLAAGCGWLALTTGPAWLGFASAFFVLLGFALFAPRLTVAGGAGVGRLARLRGAAPLLPAAGGGPGSAHPAPGGPAAAAAVPAATPAARLGWGRICLGLGAENLVRAVHRTAVIIAALMAAIAMTIGISVMIHAFRTTVQVWISRAVVADIFITPRANETLGNGAFMPPEVVRRLQTDPAVAAVDLVREIGIDYQGERISMAVVEGDQRDQLTFVGGHDHDKLARFYEPGNVLVTEAFARKHGVGEGSRLPIPTPGGVVDFTVAGVYYDYSRDQGIVAMHRSNFLRYWHDPRVMSAALHLRDPARLDAVADALRQAINGHGEFLIFSNRSLRERIFQIFDQTFAVTSVLRGIAVAVALIGIFLTLTTLVTEREREIGVLRALGASRAQLQAMVLSESALIGLLASVLGLGAGLALSVVLTFVINRAFFGWTIQLVVPWTTVLVTPLWIVGAALVAGWLPALRAGRVPIAAAVRAE